MNFRIHGIMYCLPVTGSDERFFGSDEFLDISATHTMLIPMPLRAPMHTADNRLTILAAMARSRRRRHVAEWMLAVVLVLSCTTSFAQPQPDISLQYAVKATYLYKLATFVNWPPGTFTSPDAPFDICVFGPDPFEGSLEKAVASRRWGTHPFRVRALSAVPAGAGCQIVFVGPMRANRVREVLQAFSGKPVLTVTDSGDLGDSGSIVQFVIEHGHVRFEIDNAAAIRNHLVISSKLLNLAVAVKGAR